MKYIATFLLLLLTGMTINAQTITDEQRSKALDKASRFCELLAQYSSSGEAGISNDAKIFELCSSPNITAYNELEGNNEDMLVSYLFTILGNYDCKLDMSFSKPTIEEVFGDPIFDSKIAYNGDFAFDLVDYYDIFIIISTSQQIKPLNKTINRKIIYSCNEDKIIAFTNQDSPYITLQKAFKALSAKDYNSACNYVDKVLEHKRFDTKFKKFASLIAFMSCLLSDNVQSAKKYGAGVDKGFYYYILAIPAIKDGRYKEAVQILEQAVDNGCEEGLIAAIFLANDEFGMKNVKKAKQYFLRGIESKNTYIFCVSAHNYALCGINFPEDFPLSDTQIIQYFKLAAENDYEPSYLPLSILYEENGDIESASIWDEKAANAGSWIGVARLSKYLLNSPASSDRSRGLSYLKQVQLDKIDAEIELLGSNTGLMLSFPKSSDDIRSLISKY
ncbi:MAG: hypothetical protein HDS44_03035 [Bacteroides sp.]|nr:hypothetical protein [Bacteroides sp.]